MLATESSEALYSVDLGLPAVQELEELLAYIREGIFVPDAAMAFRWNWNFPPEPPADWLPFDPEPEPVSTIPEPVCIEVKDEEEVTLPAEGELLDHPSPTEPALTSSSSGSSSDSSSESECPANKRPKVSGDLSTLACGWCTGSPGSCAACFVRTCSCVGDLSHQPMHLRRGLKIF